MFKILVQPALTQPAQLYKTKQTAKMSATAAEMLAFYFTKPVNLPKI